MLFRNNALQVILCVCFSIAGLVGCSSNDSSDNSNQSSQASSAQDKPASSASTSPAAVSSSSVTSSEPSVSSVVASSSSALSSEVNSASSESSGVVFPVEWEGEGVDDLGFSLAVIDFEVIPGAEPESALEISDQFAATHGVKFSLEPEGFPVIAQVGRPVEAFQGRGADGVRDEYDIGQFFLTDDGVLRGLIAQTLIVEYTPATSAASGEILDIDFDETFTIEAFNSLGDLMDTVVITAGDEGTGNATAATWTFDRAEADIALIRFTGTRRAAGGFGLGFDNFRARRALSPTEVAAEDP